MICKMIAITTFTATTWINPCNIVSMDKNDLWDMPFCNVWITVDNKKEPVEEIIDESCEEIQRQIKEKTSEKFQ